jgi:hypothetical protein
MFESSCNVTTLALGSWPRRGLQGGGPKERPGNHFTCYGNAKNVRNEPSHSQVNSQVGSWSPKWTPESSKRDWRAQNSLPQKVIYVFGNLLKRKCLKWACIAHLDICDTSYGQKKGHESNWQFDSWALKVGNRPNFVACRQHATYCWKDLNDGYNCALNLIVIRGLHRKLCALKIIGIPDVGISGLPLGSLGTKSHLDVAPMERPKVYYKGEGGGSCMSGLPVVHSSTKSAPTMH